MKQLYLGVAREKITPEIGGQLYGYNPDIRSETVADDLNATAFYFQQGDTKAVMVSVEVCLIHTQLSQKILALIEENFGIPKENGMLCATHTHSGPNTAGEAGWGPIDQAYCDSIFVPKILSAVGKAVENVQPVKMGTANGISLVGINRRELLDNNKVALGQNPWGPFNPQMTVISFINDKGERVGNMIHYGAHGTAAGLNVEITRDWSGGMIDALENHSGAITAFFNGPQGDVGPRLSNKRTTGDLSYVHEHSKMAAQDAVRIFDTITEYGDAKLSVSGKAVHLPLKKRMALADAEKMYETYKDATINIGGMIRTHLEEIIQSYQTDYVDAETVSVDQTVLALGDIVYASCPYELFSEIGMRIDKAFPSKSVLTLSNTNGSEGYFITKDAVCRGGYEVDMFLYVHTQQYHDDVDFYLMQETVKHIQSLEKESEE